MIFVLLLINTFVPLSFVIILTRKRERADCFALILFMVSFDCSCSVALPRADNIYALYLRNEFDFWKVHGIMNTSGLSGFTLTLQETQSILKPTANWSPYICTLVQKVKHRVYKIHVF